MVKKNKLLIFDFDGTIADTFTQTLKIFNKIALKHNLDGVTQMEAETFRNTGAKELIKKLNIPFYKLPVLMNEGREELGKSIDTTKPIPEIKNTLKKLSCSYSLAIVTSNNEKNVKRFLYLNNMEYFDFIHSARSLFGKGAILKHLLKKNKLFPQSVYYAGDEVRDVDAAHEAGVKSIGVTWGFNSAEAISRANPDYLVNRPTDLLGLKL